MQKLKVSFLTTCIGLSIFSAAAQDAYPARAVNVIVPFQAGHGVDLMARALASEFSKITGQAYPIVNREAQLPPLALLLWLQPSPMVTPWPSHPTRH